MVGENLTEIMRVMERWQRGEISDDEMVQAADALSNVRVPDTEEGRKKLDNARREAGLKGPFVRRANWKDLPPGTQVQVLAKVTASERDELYRICRELDMSFSLFIRAIAQGRLHVSQEEMIDPQIWPS